MPNDESITKQHKSIERAQRSINPLKEASPDSTCTYKCDDLEFQISCHHKTDLEPKTLKWAFKLAEKNVGPHYRSCKVGWQPKIKQADLNKSWARFLLARDARTRQLVAYSMFRFDLDYGRSVLYCYEMQVEPDYQRKGLGAFMMAALEKIAQHFQMERLVLTVLKNNRDAWKFYAERLSYEVDETSPKEDEDKGYDILSKSLL